MKRFGTFLALVMLCLMVLPALADVEAASVRTFEELQGAMFNDAIKEIVVAESLSVTETLPVLKPLTIPAGVTLTMDATMGPGQYNGLIVVEGFTVTVEGAIRIKHLEENGVPQSTAEVNMQGGTLDATNGDISGVQFQITYKDQTADLNGTLLLPADASKMENVSFQYGVVSEAQLIAANEAENCSQIMIEGNISLTQDLNLKRFTTVLNDAVLTVPDGVTVTYGPGGNILLIAGKIEGKGKWPPTL